MPRKGIPWGPKNPLWRWRKKKGLLGKWKAPKSKTRKKGRVKRNMPRRRRSRRRYSMTIPLAPVAGLAVGLSKPISYAISGNYEEAMKELAANYTGYYEGKWNPKHMVHGLAPLVVGLLVHKFVGGPPLNLNRVLGRARVPFIRI